MNRLLLVLIFIIPAVSGCENLTGEYSLYALITGKSAVSKSESDVPKKPILPEIDDTSLAKLLLKPEKYELTVERDPFRPIIEENDDERGPEPVIVNEVSMPDPMVAVRQVDFQGVVKIGSSYSALIQAQGDKGVYMVNDVVNTLKIVKITEQELTVTKDNQTFVIKRGEE
jgi:hypothetical protein